MLLKPNQGINCFDNNHVYRELSDLVAGRFTKNNNTKINCGPLEINNFSICFGMNIVFDSNVTNVYVKIPKADLFLKKQKNVMPLTDADKIFGEAEFNSLEYLSQYWDSSDLNISFVKPILFIREFNAIVTERFYGNNFFKLARKLNIMRWLGINSSIDTIVHSSLLHLGVALSRFHKKSLKECNADIIKKTIEKIQHYCSQLKLIGVSYDICNHLIDKVCNHNEYDIHTYTTNTLKGLDVRNIFIDKFKRIILLDPGKMKEDCCEADLARFLITWRILYWGSPLFFLRITPHHSYEESFLNGYYGQNMPKGSVLLKLMIIKELVKHWHMAHVVLQLKPWPNIIKKCLQHTYIDPFYGNQINHETVNLENERWSMKKKPV